MPLNPCGAREAPHLRHGVAGMSKDAPCQGHDCGGCEGGEDCEGLWGPSASTCRNRHAETPRIDVNVRLSLTLYKVRLSPCFMTSLPAGGVWPGAEKGRHAAPCPLDGMG